MVVLFAVSRSGWFADLDLPKPWPPPTTGPTMFFTKEPGERTPETCQLEVADRPERLARSKPIEH